ncbi:hypothetical protein [Sporosarcina koreensis]|uniref:hypothetical protein n=1 Tax=Sporosarcina koreensis TaxID=334735 RepID=UPI00075C66AF|nr:hypothetical protein [Sporosarcina koreensis]
MLTITTYIEQKTLDSFYFNKENFQDYFISLNDTSSAQVVNRRLKKHKGHKLEGVVIIKTIDTTMTDFMDWDDIDLMWIGILQMILEYKKTGFGEHFMAMNGHKWSIKKIITNPENLMLFRIKRNPLNFESKDSHEFYKETKNIVNEKDFFFKILQAANEFIFFREKLFKIDSVGRLKALMSEIQ